MENRDKRFCYFRITLYNLITTNIILIIFSIIDYLTVYSNLLLFISKLIDDTFDESNDFIFYISPYNLYKHYLGKVKEIDFALIIISVIAFISYISFIYCLDKIKMEPTKKFPIIFNIFFVNLYEIFIFRLLAIFFFDAIISLFLSFIDISQDPDGLKILYLILLFLYFIIYFFWNIYNLRLNSIWSNFAFVQAAFMTYPFDFIFSLKHDTILIILKICISLSKAISSLDQKNIYISNANFFISVMFVFLVFISFLHLIYDFFIKSDNFLYYQINKTNIVRIFLTTLSGTTIIIKMLLYQNYLYIIIPVLAIDLIGLILLFSFHFIDNVTSRMIKSNDYIGVLVFLISNEIDKKKYMCQWLIYHRLYCKIYLCSICQKLSLSSHPSTDPIVQNAKIEYGDFNKISFDKFFALLLDEALLQIRVKQGLTSNSIFYLECLELINYFISGRSQRVIFYVCFYKALKKYVKLNFLYHNNLLIMFDYIKKKNAEFLKQYAQFQQSEKLNDILLSFIDDFENFLHYSIKSPENVIKISEKYDSLIKNKQAIEFFPKNIQEYDYQQVIFRYVYELITKNTLPEAHEYDITSLYDLIDLRYKNDQIILIKYLFKANSSYIIKAGGAIKSNINKPFESIFPNTFKLYGLNVFIDQLYKNNFKDEKNVFEFVVKNLNEDYNLYNEAFQMKYVLYPAIETDEMIIAGSFIIEYEDILVFEKNAIRDSSLVSFSKRLEYFFGISPLEIQNFKSNGKIFTFTQLFQKKLIKDNEYGYTFNFNTYISLLNDYLEENNTDSNEEMIEKITKLKQTANTNQIKPVQLEEKFAVTTEHLTYVIYFIKTDKMKDYKKDKETTFNQTIQNHNQMYNYHNTCFDNVSMSCTSSVSSNSSRFYTKINTKKVSSIEKKGVKTINFFVRIITGFNLLLVVLCFIFLGLEINYDQQFQTLFFLFQKYKDFKIGMENESLKVLSNICFGYIQNPENANCYNVYTFYSRTYQILYPSMKQYPLIKDVVLSELKVGLENIKSSFTEFQTEIYRLNLEEIKDLYTYMTPMLTFISGKDGEVEVMITNNSFFESIHLYQNYFSQIIGNNILETTQINFINMNYKTYQIDPGKININILSQDQKNIYHVIINYPLIQTAIDKCEIMIESGFEKYLLSIEQILIVFTVLLVFLHCILVIICFNFIKNYKKVIHEDYCKVLLIISSPKYTQFITKQLANIKVLMQLYDEKPSSIMSNISFEQEIYKKNKKEEIKQIQKSKNTQIPNLHLDNQKIYDSIIAVFRKILLVTFISYIIFFIVIFAILFAVLQKLKDLVQYNSINSKIDNYIYDNLNANQFLLLTNMTAYELSSLIYNDESMNYIQEGIAQYYLNLELLEVFLRKHSDYQFIEETMNLTCGNLIEFKDKIVNASEKELGVDLSQFIIELCSNTPIMKYNSEIIVQKEICYTMKKIANYPTKMNYQSKLNYLRNAIIYDLYNIVLILNRLLRAHVNGNVLPNQVKFISTQFRAVVSTCLVINSIFEIVIVIIILYFVMKKMIELNHVFMQFMKFLE